MQANGHRPARGLLRLSLDPEPGPKGKRAMNPSGTDRDAHGHIASAAVAAPCSPAPPGCWSRAPPVRCARRPPRSARALPLPTSTPAQPVSRPPAAASALRAATSGRRTTLTHLPLSGVADGTRGVGDPPERRAGSRHAPAEAQPCDGGTGPNLGDYEFFRPASTLQPCGTYKLTIPAGTDAAGSRALGHSRSGPASMSPARRSRRCRRRSHASTTCPTGPHGFVGTSS